MPFGFEGSNRMEQAEQGLKEFRKYVDSLIVIKNDKLRDVYGNLGFKKGFQMADKVLATAVKAIAEVITSHYGVNIDLRDAKTVLSKSGTAIMGSAKAGGQNRATEAIMGALDSPLLNDNHIKGAKNVLLLIISGDEDHEITIDEIGQINEYIQNEAGGSANIILGMGEDVELKDQISVTVIATGFEGGDQPHLPGIKKQDEKIKIPLGTEVIETPPTVVETKPAAPVIQDPMNTPIAKTTRVTPSNSDGQVDLFQGIEEAEARIQQDIAPQEDVVENIIQNEPLEQEEEVKSETIETIEPSTSEELNEENDVFSSDFTDDLNSNEILFEVTRVDGPANNEPQPSIEELEVPSALPEQESNIGFEETIEETKFVLEDEFTPEESKHDADEIINTVFVESAINDADEKENIVLDEDFEFTLEDDFNISNEEIEEPQLSQKEAPLETAPILDPMNFSIDEINKITRQPAEEEAFIEEPQLVDTTEEEPHETKEPEVRKVTLDDLRELEQKLGVGTPKTEPVSKTEPNNEGDEFLDFGVKTISKEELEAKEDVNPIDNKIDFANSKLVRDRFNRLGSFQYKFTSNEVDNKEPAFKRIGLEVQNNGISDENPISRMSVNGEGNDLNINNNNSFLHDNVD
jgi:cell division protein FtsZ